MSNKLIILKSNLIVHVLHIIDTTHIKIKYIPYLWYEGKFLGKPLKSRHLKLRIPTFSKTRQVLLQVVSQEFSWFIL